MDLNNIRIGYVPYEPDLSQPGDRRRFPLFAKRFNIGFEIADTSKKYDLILLTAPANLSRWMKYKQQNPDTIFIFEMVDSLLFISDLFTRVFKGPGRYLLKREDDLHFNFSKLLHRWIEIADLVICSNTALRDRIAEINPEVIISPDYLETEYNVTKTNFEIEGKMKLVWEGLPSVLPHFLAFKDVFKSVADFCELHVISKPKYPKIPKLVYGATQDFLKKLPIDTYYYDWNIDTHNTDLIKGDCGIIPLNRENSFGWNKPANKLISFWFLGLPTVVSATPAYKEVMGKAKSNLICESQEEWVSKLKWYYDLSPLERKQIAEKNRTFVMQYYSNDQLDKIWNQAFERALKK